MKNKAKETADARAFAHKSIEVAAHQLRFAPWNPRPEITSESVADITASLPKVGLIHPLVVMKDPDKKGKKGEQYYLIISGHRRFKACVDAEYFPIPCDLVDVDVEKAKQMTIIENLQRRDADPLMESELVASLIEGGMTKAEIAAECEVDRRDKISKAMTKLQELVWETGAVSERIHRERGDKDPGFDAQDRDMCNEVNETRLRRLWEAAKELELSARALWDPTAPEVVEPDVEYPGFVEPPDKDTDPNQPLLGLTPKEPPAIDPSRLVDYKMEQANDDTTKPEGDGE